MTRLIYLILSINKQFIILKNLYPVLFFSAPVNLKNLSRTSDRIPTVGTYADTLINRYSSHYSSSSGTRRNKNDPLFSNENDYVNHLLDKYSKSSWRK